MAVLIPYQRLKAVPAPAADDKMDTTDSLDDDFKVGEDVDMVEVVDENVDVSGSYGQMF